MEDGMEIEVTSEDVSTYLSTTEKCIEDYIAGMEDIESLQDLLHLNADLVSKFASAYDVLVCANMPKH